MTDEKSSDSKTTGLRFADVVCIFVFGWICFTGVFVGGCWPTTLTVFWIWLLTAGIASATTIVGIVQLSKNRRILGCSLLTYWIFVIVGTYATGAVTIDADYQQDASIVAWLACLLPALLPTAAAGFVLAAVTSIIQTVYVRCCRSSSLSSESEPQPQPQPQPAKPNDQPSEVFGNGGVFVVVVEPTAYIPLAS